MSNWTVYEALSVIKTRVGAPAAETLWERLTNSAYVRLVNVDPAMERSALDLFFAYEDKTWGVVDCASLVVMEQLRCGQAFAFDRHFVEASGQRGFEVLKAT